MENSVELNVSIYMISGNIINLDMDTHHMDALEEAMKEKVPFRLPNLNTINTINVEYLKVVTVFEK